MDGRRCPICGKCIRHLGIASYRAMHFRKKEKEKHAALMARPSADRSTDEKEARGE